MGRKLCVVARCAAEPLLAIQAAEASLIGRPASAGIASLQKSVVLCNGDHGKHRSGGEEGAWTAEWRFWGNHHFGDEDTVRKSVFSPLGLTRRMAVLPDPVKAAPLSQTVAFNIDR